jgi:hypothetical protein
MGFQPLSFDQYGAPGERTEEFFENLSTHLSRTRTAALVQLYAGSFWSSPIAYGLTKLLPYWQDNRQRLPIRCLLCLLEYSYGESLTVSRMRVIVYNVSRKDFVNYDRIYSRLRTGPSLREHAVARSSPWPYASACEVGAATCCGRAGGGGFAGGGLGHPCRSRFSNRGACARAVVICYENSSKLRRLYHLY